MVALRFVQAGVDLFSFEKFKGCERVHPQVCDQPYEEEVDLGHQQADGKNAHQAAVGAPELEDDVACCFGVRKVLGLVVLDGVEEKWGERIAEKVVDAR